MIHGTRISRDWSQQAFARWLAEEMDRMADYAYKAAYGETTDDALEVVKNRLMSRAIEKFGEGPPPETIARLAQEVKDRRRLLLENSLARSTWGNAVTRLGQSAAAQVHSWRLYSAIAVLAALFGVLQPRYGTREWAALALTVLLLLLIGHVLLALAAFAGRGALALLRGLAEAGTRGALWMRQVALNRRLAHETVRRGHIDEFVSLHVMNEVEI
jgi:hypothetical protein